MKKNTIAAICLAMLTLFATGCTQNKNGTAGDHAKYYVDEYGMTGDMSFMTARINAIDGINSSDVYVYDNYIAVRLDSDKAKLDQDFRKKIESVIREYYPTVDTVDIIY